MLQVLKGRPLIGRDNFIVKKSPVVQRSTNGRVKATAIVILGWELLISEIVIILLSSSTKRDVDLTVFTIRYEIRDTRIRTLVGVNGIKVISIEFSESNVSAKKVLSILSICKNRRKTCGASDST